MAMFREIYGKGKWDVGNSKSHLQRWGAQLGRVGDALHDAAEQLRDVMEMVHGLEWDDHEAASFRVPPSTPWRRAAMSVVRRVRHVRGRGRGRVQPPLLRLRLRLPSARGQPRPRTDQRLG